MYWGLLATPGVNLCPRAKLFTTLIDGLSQREGIETLNGGPVFIAVEPVDRDVHKGLDCRDGPEDPDDPPVSMETYWRSMNETKHEVEEAKHKIE